MHTSEAIQFGRLLERTEVQDRRIRAIEKNVTKLDRRLSLVSKEIARKTINPLEKWIIRGLQFALAGTTAWATGSISKGLEILSLFPK